LEKYDVGDVDNSHVYVSATVPSRDQGNWSAPCIRSGSFDNINKRNANKENRNVTRRCSNSVGRFVGFVARQGSGGGLYFSLFLLSCCNVLLSDLQPCKCKRQTMIIFHS
jgi:hypothetical protein